MRGGSTFWCCRSATTAPCPSSTLGAGVGGSGGGSEGMAEILSIDGNCKIPAHMPSVTEVFKGSVQRAAFTDSAWAQHVQSPHI